MVEAQEREGKEPICSVLANGVDRPPLWTRWHTLGKAMKHTQRVRLLNNTSAVQPMPSIASMLSPRSATR